MLLYIPMFSFLIFGFKNFLFTDSMFRAIVSCSRLAIAFEFSLFFQTTCKTFVIGKLFIKGFMRKTVQKLNVYL